MVSSKWVEDRKRAVNALGSAFGLLPDKIASWQDLHRLTSDEDYIVRLGVTDALGSVFALLPDKTAGSQDLHRLASDEDYIVRRGAVYALNSVFGLLPDKNISWQYLIKLVADQVRDVQRSAAYVLSSVFCLLPDKTAGWQDLHRLTSDKDYIVRRGAASALSSAFCLLPDKTAGWQDLHRLTSDKDCIVRRSASDALSSVFAHLSDKTEGWQDLIRLISDEDYLVQRNAAITLSYAFALLPDKTAGWQDLHRLTSDQDNDVRRRAAATLGSAFTHIPDKTAGWQDLIRLTSDQDSGVRAYAYHSMGRVSVHKAAEASEKNTMRSELEVAVEFFEKSSQEGSYFSPARFCHPFYRSYLALTFQGASDAEVQRYLIEAKEAVGGSENKKELLGAVENLAKALEETQKLKERSMERIQSDLKAYRWYCDQAAEHLAAAEEKAPGAVKLLRKCNPIIEERIEAIISDIQKTARIICQVTRGSGTKYEVPGAKINQEARCLSPEDPLGSFRTSIRIALSLKELCGLLPHDKRGRACEIVNEIETEKDLPSRLFKIDLALTYLQPNITLAAYESATNTKLEEMHSDIKFIDKKIDTIIFDLSHIKIGSGDIVANLWAVRTELTKIAEMEKSSALIPRDISEHPYFPNEEQIELGNLIETKVLELEEILKTKATKEDSIAILKEMEDLKPSVGFEWMGRIADAIAIFDASIKVFAFLK